MRTFISLSLISALLTVSLATAPIQPAQAQAGNAKTGAPTFLKTRRSGYKEWKRRITLNTGSEITLDAALEKIP
jgi:uncharacterized sporulation protein YeaH/YhbH (DUF444 family)